MAPAPVAPSALELPPTTGEAPGGNGTKPPTPEAATTAKKISVAQENGDPARITLEGIAAQDQSPPPKDGQGATPAHGGLAAPDVAAATTPTAPARQPEVSTDAALPPETPENTAKINHLLSDAANHLVWRHDPRFVLMASARAASPETPVGSELRKNALIALHDLKPRTGPWGLIDKNKSDTLANAASGLVTKDDQASSAALVGFLTKERDSLDADLRDDLLPLELLKKVRTGEAQVPELMDHFSKERIPLLKTVADNLHREATGKTDGRMPTSSGEMLAAAGIDGRLNRMQLKQMLHPEQFNTMQMVKQYGPIAFILFMSALQMFPQEQQGRQGAQH